jgi:hypothetical protein
MSYLSSDKRNEYAKLWKKVNEDKPSIADDKAGYPPNCNEGYEEKDGKCIPIERAKGKSPQKKKDNYSNDNTAPTKEAACSLTQEQAVTISSKIAEVLQKIVKEFNSKHNKRITLDKVKASYRKGARASKKHDESEFGVNTWAFAGVNLFLQSYLSKSSDIVLGDFFVKATEDIEKYDVDVEYNNIDELYLEAYTPFEMVY